MGRLGSSWLRSIDLRCSISARSSRVSRTCCKCCSCRALWNCAAMRAISSFWLFNDASNLSSECLPVVLLAHGLYRMHRLRNCSHVILAIGGRSRVCLWIKYFSRIVVNCALIRCSVRLHGWRCSKRDFNVSVGFVYIRHVCFHCLSPM